MLSNHLSCYKNSFLFSQSVFKRYANKNRIGGRQILFLVLDLLTGTKWIDIKNLFDSQRCVQIKVLFYFNIFLFLLLFYIYILSSVSFINIFFNHYKSKSFSKREKLLCFSSKFPFPMLILHGNNLTHKYRI